MLPQSWPRTTLLLTARHCAARALPATAVALAVTLVAVCGFAPKVATDATAAAIPWLQLPPLVAAAACCLAAVEFWPTLARGRPGADFVRRCTGAPWGGGIAAAAGALVALSLLLLATAAMVAPLLPGQHAHRAIPAVGRPLLDGDGQEVRFAVGSRACRELRLRPVALLPPSEPAPTSLQLLVDGSALPTTVSIVETRQLVRVPTEGRRIDALAIRRTGGTLPLLFADDAVVAVDAEAQSRLASGALAFGLYLVPAAVALAFALLLAPFVALPVAFVVVAAALAMQVFAAASAAPMAVAFAARGQWTATAPVFRACIPSLGTGLAAMIVGMVLRRRTRR